ncbi:CHAP domain-containing protein [Terrabacter sp. C0L_2]|uniref:CHAP domain-containing protein n=1 Tax=Terrabacter sp. C0L_2 TaxID=3108389 RepID=UPI00180930A0|nr:CHAP domain-containing protein [Dermatophilaceae bacterium]WVM95511.1 CHAP domain-containing protein [Terrabacter sp. C0L_2]
MNTTRRPGRHRPPGKPNPLTELGTLARESAQPAMKGAAILAATGGLISTLAPSASAESSSSASAPAVTGPASATTSGSATAVPGMTARPALTSIGFTPKPKAVNAPAATVITDVAVQQKRDAAHRAAAARREAQARASRDQARRALSGSASADTSVGVSVPRASAGGRSSYNWGSPGQCTWGVLNKWYQSEGYYPGGWTGNALVWGTRAADAGYTVSGTPRTRSVVVMQPGVHGSSSAGHLGWVTAVNGDQVTIIEMNALAGPFNYNTRTVTDISGMQYIYAP